MAQPGINGNLSGNFGTTFADGIRMGSVSHPIITTGRPGLSNPCIVPYYLQPRDKITNSIFSLDEVADDGYLELRTDVPSMPFGYQPLYGTKAIDINIPRSLQVKGIVTTDEVTFTFSLIDVTGQKLVHQVVLPPGNETVETTVACRYVTAVHSSNLSGGEVNIGTSNHLGLPIVVDSVNKLGVPIFDGEYDLYANVEAGGAAQEINITTRYPFQPAFLGEATATTGDRRGLYRPPGLADGYKDLTLNLISDKIGGFKNTAINPPELITTVTPAVYDYVPEPTNEDIFGKPNYSEGWVKWQS